MMPRRKKWPGQLAVLVLWGATTACAAESDRLVVSSLRPLLTLAIDQGTARGVLVGAAAEVARRRFGADAPIEVDVRAIRALTPAGCSRLEVTTRQNNVPENGPQSQRRDQTLRYQVSYCRDGHLRERP